MQSSLPKSGCGRIAKKKKPVIGIKLLLFLACCHVLGSVAITIHDPRSG
jgi:hypothetical protein